MMEKYEIQKLRELPIEKVAKEMGMKVEHHKALCPFHDDHHASLTFNETKNSCRCYVCMRNSIGTIDLAMRYLGKDFPSACRWLAEEHQIQLEEDSSSGSSSGDSSSGDNSGKSSFDASRYARFFEHPWLNQAARRFLFEERKIDWRAVADGYRKTVSGGIPHVSRSGCAGRKPLHATQGDAPPAGSPPVATGLQGFQRILSFRGCCNFREQGADKQMIKKLRLWKIL